MQFHATAKFTQGVADVDPVAAPATILEEHFLIPDSAAPKDPSALYIALLGASTETVTLSLYFLIENGLMGQTFDDYKVSTARWFPFATGQVITNGTLTKITSGLPAGGIIYARRTADAITASQTRALQIAWQ